MKTVLIVAAALIVGIAIGYLLGEATIRHLRKRLRAYRAGKAPVSIFQSVTRFLFVTTQVFALGWVTVSYGIAAYSTVKLMQPFPVEQLSCQAIITLLGVSALKVVENIFEHNEGVVFGWKSGTRKPPGETSADEEPPEEIPTEETDAEG